MPGATSRKSRVPVRLSKESESSTLKAEKGKKNPCQGHGPEVPASSKQDHKNPSALRLRCGACRYNGRAFVPLNLRFTLPVGQRQPRLLSLWRESVFLFSAELHLGLLFFCVIALMTL